MKIGLIGYGKTAKEIERISSEVGATIETVFRRDSPFDQSSEEVKNCDVLIDFSVSENVLKNVETAIFHSKPLVIGTTGWTDQLDEVQSLVKESKIAVIYGSNFSLGVNLFFDIVEEASKRLATWGEFSPAVEDEHHEHKKDAPSGTMKTILGVMKEFYPQAEIPLAVKREGDIPGTHRVKFKSSVDELVLTHEAKNREGFAKGALLAAKWIQGQQGFYFFRELVQKTWRKN